MPDTTRGMYVNILLDEVRRVRGVDAVTKFCTDADAPEKFRALQEYPIETVVRVQQQVVKVLHPELDVKEGMFRIGSRSFQAFADSMLGKIGLALVSGNLPRLADRLPAFYDAANKFGHVETKNVSDEHFDIRFKGYRTYPEYQHGLIENGLQNLGFTTDVKLQTIHFEDRGNGDIHTDFTLTVTKK